MKAAPHESALYSGYWYRVESLRPRLQPGTRIRRQLTRGTEWFVFSHPVSGKYYRLNRKAYELIGRLDGEHTLNALWVGMQNHLGDEAPTQDEAITILAQLLEVGLVLFDSLPDLSVMRQYQSAQAGRDLTGNLNPFSFRLRLFNPEPWLARLVPLQSALMRPMAAVLWIVMIGWALMRVMLNWEEIHAYAKIHLLTSRGLLMAWLAYPIMKFLHELGHAFAVRHWGGKVHEAGIGFFFLIPAPYVDATSATAFGSKWQKAAVSFAGIAVEMAMAGLALAIWSFVETGVVRDVAMVVMVIGGLSTVVFNANPLLRFDGYYIVCDVFELPNLASRSQRWWTQLARRIVKGAHVDAESNMAPGEAGWLALYTPASWFYRLTISIVAVHWVVVKSILAGYLAAAWLGYSLLLQPLWAATRHFCAPDVEGRHHSVRKAVLVGAAFAMFAVVVLLPFPMSTMAEGVVWLPEHSQVRASSDGRISVLHVRDGQQVKKGQALVTLEEPSLLYEKRRLLAQIAAAETEQISGSQKEIQQASNAAEQLARLHADLSELQERLDGLTLRSGADGTFVFPHQDDMLGRQVLKGTVVAYVLGRDEVTVRAAVSQDDIGRVRSGAKEIEVLVNEAGARPAEGRLLRIEPAATHALPSKAIGDHGGGSLITDPADPGGMTLLEPVYLADILLPGYVLAHAGGRVAVRFSYKPQPLADTVGWRLRQLFLRSFTMVVQ